MTSNRRSIPARGTIRVRGCSVAIWLCSASVLLGSSPCFAAPRAPRDTASRCREENKRCRDPQLAAPRENSIAGRVVVAGALAAALPTGEFETGVSQRQFMGVGPLGALDLAYGVGSFFTVGAWWQYGRFGSGSSCSGCVAGTLGVGADVGYHPLVVQAVDPFVTFGLGYRSTAYGDGINPDITYSGFEWLRLQAGADWYLFRHVGFGAFVELDAGTFEHKASTPLSGTAAHEQLLFGGRVAFDALGRGG